MPTKKKKKKVYQKFIEFIAIITADHWLHLALKKKKKHSAMNNKNGLRVSERVVTKNICNNGIIRS